MLESPRSNPTFFEASEATLLPTLLESLTADPNPEAQWLANYLSYVLNGDAEVPWWMHTPHTIVDELQHWNGWNSHAITSPSTEVLTASAIVPVSERLLHALVAQANMDSQLYHALIFLHEQLRAAARAEYHRQIETRPAVPDLSTTTLSLFTPVWEILHKPGFAQYAEVGVGYYDFRTGASAEQYGFAVEEPTASDPTGVVVTYTYLFSSYGQAVAIYDTMQHRPGVHLSPLVDLSGEEFPPLLAVAEETTNANQVQVDYYTNLLVPLKNPEEKTIHN